MKKFLFITAIVSLLFAGCANETRKLPSKMIKSVDVSFIDYEVDFDSYVVYHKYFYDELNRLVRIVVITDEDTSFMNIFYNSDNLPVRIEDTWNWMGYGDFDIIYQDDGRTIILEQDTFWLNDKGQMVKWVRKDFHPTIFTYNLDGSIDKWISGPCGDGDRDSCREPESLKYSDIPAIWRHVNAPDWFIWWLFQNLLVFPFERTGNIILWDGYFEVDANNYLTRLTCPDSVETRKYQWILAN